MTEPESTKLFNDNELYKEAEAAAGLKLVKTTLRNSRNTGMLAGVRPPRHIKRGRTVLYSGRALNEWHAQFETPPTMQSRVAGGEQ